MRPEGKLYYEAVESDSGWGWEIYGWDKTGNIRVVAHRSLGAVFDNKEKAEDACAEWMEEHGVEAELP